MVGLFSHWVMKTFSEANKILLVVAELVELVPVQVFHMFPVVALVLAPHMCLDLVSRMCLGEQDHCPPMVRIHQQLLSNLAVHFLVLPRKLPAAL